MRVRAVFCDGEGNVYDHPELGMAGANGARWSPLRFQDTIPLPEGSDVVALPGRHPVGCDPEEGGFVCFPEMDDEAVSAAAAVLPPAFLRTLLPAQERVSGAPALPLLGYAALGWADDGPRVAAMRLDDRTCWDPQHFATQDLAQRVDAQLAALPGNRIVEQLARCSLEYNCYTAQNFFYRRWEAGVPVSSRCNARCKGCISLQPSECCPSPQQRIDFEPTVDEVVAVLRTHLSTGSDAIVSFGQGCEGEPLLQADLIAEAVGQARQTHPGGTVNINTNGSRPEVVEALADAGVNSLRVTLASADPTTYHAYHQPVGYTFDHVAETVDRAKSRGLWVSVNLLAFPGVTDTRDHAKKLITFLGEHNVDVVQMRNLNFDPDDALESLIPLGPGKGIPWLVRKLKRELPKLILASFNQSVER